MVATSDGHAANHRDKAFFVAMADLHYAATVAQQLRAPPSPSMARASCPPPSAAFCGHSLPHQSPPPAPTVLSRATQPLSIRRPMVNATGSSACGSSSDSSSRSLLLQQPSRRRSRAATWKAGLAGSASLPHSAEHPIASTPTQRRGPGSPASLPSQPRRRRRRQQHEVEEEELLEHAWGAVLEAEVGDAMLRQRLDDALAAALRKRRLQQQRGKRSQTTRRKASKGATTSSRRSSGHVRLADDAGVAPPFLLGLNFPLGLARPPRDWRPPPPLPPTAEQEEERRAGGGPGSRRTTRGRSPPRPPVWKRVALEDVRSRTRSRSKGSRGQRRGSRQQQQDALVGEEVLWALRGRGARPAEVDEVLAISRLRNQPHKKKTSSRPEEEAPDGCSSPPPPLRFGQSAWPLPTPLDQPLPAPPPHKPRQAATSGGRRRRGAGEGSSSGVVVVVPYSVAADVGTRAVSPTHLLRRPGLRLGHTYSHVGPRVLLPTAAR